MEIEKVISDWKASKYKPVYWFEGEEEYFIDMAVNFAENNILSESEASFNLTVFYGRDASWTDVVNACRRYPMFAERQVVILKEAQQMRDYEKLEGYIAQPLQSTIFVVALKGKKVDARTKFSKLLKSKAVMVTTKKVNESGLNQWTGKIIAAKGLTITPVAQRLLVDHIGNDLSRIANEIDKLSLNLGARKSITEDDIEEFIGISKEFNVFELQTAIGRKDLAAAIRIIQYFEANPKAGPIQMILPTLYSYFSKVYMVHGTGSTDERKVAAETGMNYYVSDYIKATTVYSFGEVERALLLLHNYNLRSVGVNDSGTGDSSLLKEMVIKMMA